MNEKNIYIIIEINYLKIRYKSIYFSYIIFIVTNSEPT